MLSLFPLFLPLLVCWLISFIVACTRMEHGLLEQRCDLMGMNKKDKDASPQGAMISRIGGLDPPEWFPLSLSF